MRQREEGKKELALVKLHLLKYLNLYQPQEQLCEVLGLEELMTFYGNLWECLD